MDSADRIIAEIDGLKIYIDGKLSGMEKRLSAIENDNREIRTELRLIEGEMRGVNTRLEDMKHYMSLTFGAIAVFVAAVALTPIVQKIIQAWRKPGDDDRMRLIFREEYEKLKADGKPI